MHACMNKIIQFSVLHIVSIQLNPAIITGSWLSLELLHPGVINNINPSVSLFSILITWRMPSPSPPLPWFSQSCVRIPPAQRTMWPVTSVLRLRSAVVSSTWSHMEVSSAMSRKLMSLHQAGCFFYHHERPRAAPCHCHSSDCCPWCSPRHTENIPPPLSSILLLYLVVK